MAYDEKSYGAYREHENIGLFLLRFQLDLAGFVEHRRYAMGTPH
jgi:hypothetical protein